MKLIKIISKEYRQWDGGKPTNEYRRQTYYLNPEYIISLESINDSDKKGAMITRITMQGAMVSTYYTDASMEEIVAMIDGTEYKDAQTDPNKIALIVDGYGTTLTEFLHINSEREVGQFTMNELIDVIHLQVGEKTTVGMVDVERVK